MGKASGRDFDDLAEKLSKSVGSLAKKTIRGRTHDNTEQGLRLVGTGLREFADEVQPHVSLSPSTLSSLAFVLYDISFKNKEVKLFSRC
jgi:hypothetical protein